MRLIAEFPRRRLGFYHCLGLVACLTGGWFIFGASISLTRRCGAEEIDADKIIATGKLNRFEPLSVAEAEEAFEVAPGYRIELVAAEPLVIDPVAFCFDARGRLIVVEMRGYSERAESHTGRVRRLIDVDGDGRMDEVETLIDGLAWPTAVACWGDGILVGVAPRLMYVPPPEAGGGEAAEVWFEGFGTSNVQGLFNSFQWGPDLRMHGATSSSGGEVLGQGWDAPLRLGRRDFAISIPDREFQPVDGGAQHGMSFGRWGEKFVCSNSDHLQQVLMLSPREQRAKRYSQVPPLRRSIAADGPQADVFRSSPPEPWRILRTHLRVTGQVGGPVEGGGRAAGYFTGATGVHAYVGDQWPETQQPIAVVCDVGGNLVHRKRLEDDGLWYRGVRIDEQTEFVRSTDTWFRPVQLGDGPDGALYIADMYREVIEHPKSLPPEIKSQVDLNSGNDRGRIWRVVAEDRPLRRAISQPLDELPSAKLVELLAHDNAWQRRTAARLLVERRELDSLSALRQVAQSDSSPEARLEALAVLANYETGIDQATLQSGWSDDHPRVRQRAIELAADQVERFGSPEPNQLKRLAEDPSIHVRFQLAHDAITLIPDPQRRAEILAAIAAADSDNSWIRWAVEGSLGTASEAFLRQLAARSDGNVSAEWLETIAGQILHQGSGESVTRLIAWLGSEDQPEAARLGMLAAVARQLNTNPPGESLAPLREWTTGNVTPDLLRRAKRGELRFPADRQRLALAAWASASDAARLLEQLLTPDQSLEAQRAALQTLVTNDRELAAWVINRLPSMTPTVQGEAWTALGTTREGLLAIAAAIADEELAATAIPAAVADVMRQSKDRSIRAAVENLAARPAVSAAVVQRYKEALASQPDADAGKATFDRVCAVCHQPKAGARPVGPPLKSVVEKSPEQILMAILDPNLEVDPKYYRLQVVTTAGQVLSGILVEELDQSLVLIDSQAKEHVIARADVESLQTSDQSLMPENLAGEINETQMRDLIAYVKQLLE